MPLQEARQRIRQGLWTRKSSAARQALHAELQREAGLQDTIDAALATGRDDAVAGRFQGVTVSLAELRLLGPSSDATSPEALRGRLQDLVLKTKLAERARQQHLDADPKLRARVRWSRARVLATLEMTREVNQVLVPPTPAELRAQFEAHRDRYEHPPEQDLSVIELPFAAPTGRQAFDAAEALAARLRSGEREFSEAARSLSQHASAPSGGRLGWLTNRQAAPLGPNVLRALGQASPGQIVGPVQQDDNLWILKLWERHAARPLSFEEASPRVDQELGNVRVAEIQQRLEAAARQALDLHLLEATPGGP
jgi:hypothetical protein